MTAPIGTPKRELLKELQITDRLLKFWTMWYKLPINRRGRGSNYPPDTVECLRIIKRLSDSGYYTMKYIRDLLAVARGGDRENLERMMRLCRTTMDRRVRTVQEPASTPSPVRSEPGTIASSPRPNRLGDDLL